MIPKAMRDALGVDGPTELELTELDGRLELSVPYADARIEKDGELSTIVIEPAPPSADAGEVRAALERVRR